MAKKVKLYVQKGGTLVKTQNVPLVDNIIVAKMAEIQLAIENDKYPFRIDLPSDMFDYIHSSLNKFCVKNSRGLKADEYSIAVYYGGMNSKPIVRLYRGSVPTHIVKPATNAPIEEQVRESFPANIEGSKEFNEANKSALKEDFEKMTKVELVAQIIERDGNENRLSDLMKMEKEQLIEMLCGSQKV